jgi:hypothetical protein
MDEEITYRIKSAVGGRFGVVLGPINGGMTTVSPFDTAAEARAWIEKQIGIHGTGASCRSSTEKVDESVVARPRYSLVTNRRRSDKALLHGFHELMVGAEERVAGYFRNWISRPEFKAAMHRFDGCEEKPTTRAAAQ